MQRGTKSRYRKDTSFSPPVIKLYNPYHDRLGRFATASGAQAISGKNAAHAVQKELSKQIDGLGKTKIRTYRDQRSFHEVAWPHSQKFAPAAIYSSGTIHINPRITRALSRKPPKRGMVISEDDPRYARHVVAHELIHGRLRKGRTPRLMSPAKRRALVVSEESLTEALARRHTAQKYKLGSSVVTWRHPYTRYAIAATALAMDMGGGNTRRAWKWLDEAHKRNSDTQWLKKQIGDKYGITVTDNDLTNYFAAQSGPIVKAMHNKPGVKVAARMYGGGGILRFADDDSDLLDQMIGYLAHDNVDRAEALMKRHPNNAALSLAYTEYIKHKDASNVNVFAGVDNA